MAETEADSKPQQPIGLSRWTPSIPTNLMSMLNPFATDDSNKPNGETNSPTQPANKRMSILSSFLPGTTTTPAEPPSPQKDDNSIMFDEPDTHSNSDDASRDGSVDESGRRRSKRNNKPKTSFSLCHPAPTTMTRQKLHRRPRSLLQLHKLSTSERPRPAYEVIPSAGFSVRLTKAIKRVYRTTHTLCASDLVVVRAEKYSTHEASEEQEAKDIVCLICKGRKEDAGSCGKAKIYLPGGREWEAYSTPIGGYEFFSTDEHGLGLTVRWVPKKNRDGSKQQDSMKKRFNFSTISPNSRKHPVIAMLSRTQLEINDYYKMPNASAVTPLSTPKQGSTFLADAMEDDFDGSEQCETDDRLRDIIVMTGIWVAFKEGWSPNFKYDDKEKDVAALQRSPSLQHSPSKSGTFSTPLSTPPASPGLEKRNSMKSAKSVGGSMFRSSSLLRKGNRSSAASVPEVDEDPADQFDATRKTGRSRADSASTVLVHRAASNRARHHQATWRPDLLDAQREVSEDRSSRSDRMDSPFGASPKRTEPVARPILPSAAASATTVNDEGDDVPSPSRRMTSTPADAVTPEKRESSTTTTTTSTTSETGRKPRDLKQSRRKSGWRRILCGSGQDV